MNDLIPIALFFFIYSFAMTLVKTRNRRNILKMMIDNDLIKNGENNISFKFLSSDENTLRTNYMLPVALGLLGVALGLVCGAFLIVTFSYSKIYNNNYNWGVIREAIQLGCPLFFASIGVIVAYFIEKREKKEKKQA